MSYTNKTLLQIFNNNKVDLLSAHLIRTPAQEHQDNNNSNNKAPTNSRVANNNDTKQEEGEGGYTKQSSYTQAAMCGKQNIVKFSSAC